jgi:hypothetical protein
MATDLEIVLEDRPGTLAILGEALGNAGINIQGVAGFAFEGRGIVHVLVDDAGGAKAALGSAGVEVRGEADALVMELPTDAVDKPGELGRMARQVAEAGVNFTALYLATGNRGVAVTSDNAKALAALT